MDGYFTAFDSLTDLGEPVSYAPKSTFSVPSTPHALDTRYRAGEATRCCCEVCVLRARVILRARDIHRARDILRAGWYLWLGHASS